MDVPSSSQATERGCIRDASRGAQHASWQLDCQPREKGFFRPAATRGTRHATSLLPPSLARRQRSLQSERTGSGHKEDPDTEDSEGIRHATDAACASCVQTEGIDRVGGWESGDLCGKGARAAPFYGSAPVAVACDRDPQNARRIGPDPSPHFAFKTRRVLRSAQHDSRFRAQGESCLSPSSATTPLPDPCPSPRTRECACARAQTHTQNAERVRDRASAWATNKEWLLQLWRSPSKVTERAGQRRHTARTSRGRRTRQGRAEGGEQGK
eukprot:5595872-Pleurochrysis_carterae.AAC.3